MGFFDAFKQVAAEGPGRVNMIFLKEVTEAMATMNEASRNRVLVAFCEKRNEQRNRLSNMSTDGILKTARGFQVAGNKLKKASPVDGYPLLMVGLWLESGYRPGIDAATVNEYLDAMMPPDE